MTSDLPRGHDPIAEAAIRFVHARAEAKRLREERGAILCEREVEHEKAVEDWHANPYGPGPHPPRPCWKDREEPEYEEGRVIHPGGLGVQCSACERRYCVHLAYQGAMKERGAALRSLMARVKRSQR